MLLAIFGAGASYDSLPYLPITSFDGKRRLDEEFRPPLANQLFDVRFASVPRNRHLPPIVTRMLPPNSVEAELDRLLRKADTNPEIRKQLAAVRYYLQGVIAFCQNGWSKRIAGLGGTTNYRSFMDEVEDWRQRVGTKEVLLVTFNYDTLLEEALAEDRRFQFRARSIGDYVSGPYKVMKPHGSINWTHHISQYRAPALYPKNSTQLRDLLIESADSLRIDPDIDVDLNWESDLIPTIPALAIPVETKSDLPYECPNEHVEALRKFLPSVKKLITIGWRATEQRFVEELVAGLTPDVSTLVVSSSQDSADKIATHMREKGLKGTLKPAPVSGFTEFVKKSQTEEFLNR